MQDLQFYCSIHLFSLKTSWKFRLQLKTVGKLLMASVYFPQKISSGQHTPPPPHKKYPGNTPGEILPLGKYLVSNHFRLIKKGLESSISDLLSTLQSFYDDEVEVWMRKGQSPFYTESICSFWSIERAPSQVSTRSHVIRSALVKKKKKKTHCAHITRYLGSVIALSMIFFS